MKLKQIIPGLLIAALTLGSTSPAQTQDKPVRPNIDTFVRAETDHYLKLKVERVNLRLSGYYAVLVESEPEWGLWPMAAHWDGSEWDTPMVTHYLDKICDTLEEAEQLSQDNDPGWSSF